jgi:hypothetical protein
MNTANAIPLNNPQSDIYLGELNAIARSEDVFGQWYSSINNRAIIPIENDSIVVTSGHFIDGNAIGTLYVYDLRAINPPQRFTGSLFHNITKNNIDLTTQIPVITLNKSLYSFYIDGDNIGVMKNDVVIDNLAGYPISSKTIMVEWGSEMHEVADENAILNTQLHAFYDYDNMYIYKSGILSIESTSDGEDITYSWIAKDLSFIFDKGGSVWEPPVFYFIKNENIYQLSDNIVKFVNPKTDSTYTTYFNGVDFNANNIWFVGDDIYFTRYESATSVSTYRLKEKETNPTKISSSEIVMQTIVELNF